MFDKRSGIEAVVLPIRSGDPNTDPYHEWTAPTKLELHRKNALQYGPNVAFITPDVGDQFSIKVFVHPITNFVQQPEIHVTCTIDGLAYTSCNGTIQKIPEAARDGPPLSVVLDSTVLTTNGEKQWCSFNFSRLKLSKNYLTC